MVTTFALCISLFAIKLDYFFDSVPGNWAAFALIVFLVLYFL